MTEQLPAPEQPQAAPSERQILSWAEVVSQSEKEKAAERVGEQAGEMSQSASAQVAPDPGDAATPVPPASIVPPAATPAALTVRYTTPTAVAEAALRLKRMPAPSDAELSELAHSLKALRRDPDPLNLEQAEVMPAETR